MSNSSDETGKGSKGLRSSVRSNGHVSSGGHNGRAARTAKQNSAYSRANRPRWDVSDGNPTGGEMVSQYQEYPKLIYTDDKNYIVVQDANQERQVLGGEEIIDEEDERIRLFAVAKVKGVQVDKRWGPAKLTKAIEEAGFDPTLNPFE